MALPKVEGRITVPTGGYSLSVTEVPAATASVTVAAGDYYLSTSTSLITALQTALTDNATLQGEYTVALDAATDTSTGKVTISASGITSFAITWTSTALRDRLGFSINTGAALTVTGAEQAEYLWLPNCDRSNIKSPQPSSASQSMGARETDLTIAMAPSGAVVALQYNTRFKDSFEFLTLKGYKTFVEHEVTANESLEKFFSDVISTGKPFRYHPDRSSDARYFPMRIMNPNFEPNPAIANWTEGDQSLWAVSYEMRKHV